MAEEKKEAGDPMQNVYFIVTILVVIVILWFASGGPSRADLRGILLSPPPEAGGTGEAHGPNPQPQFEGGSVAPPEPVQPYRY